MMIGQTISHYRIIEKLGQGGMGEVYLAEDLKLDRKVAIKCLALEHAADAESRERFVREARAQARLNHPNIATFHEVGEEGGRAFIVMEYIDGSDLSDRTGEESPPIEDTLDLAIQLAEGLQAAHEHDIIHRDIKPRNIMVTRKGHLKITDFGLARWKESSHLTQTGTRMGTPLYMSPEQTEGKSVDLRTDIFSAGVVIYELIAGRRPFDGEHAAAISYSVVHDQPEPLARYKTQVPAGLQQIVDKCLSKKVDERYQSCADLVADLKREKRLLDSGATPGTTPAHATSAQGRTNRSRVVMAASTVIVLALIAVAYFKPWTSDDESPHTTATAATLAVLPFANQGAPEDEYFADGITDEITTHLAKISGLRVISRASALKYKGSHLSQKEIAEQLGVNYVLDGTIRWDKSSGTDRVRISPELIHVTDGFRVWGESYHRDLTQIFDVQADIADQIATALGLTLLASQRGGEAFKPTENMVAYDYYLRARDKLNRGTEMVHFRDAIELLHKAIEEDPDFLVAYATLAQTHTTLYWYYHSRPELDSAQRIFDLILEQDQLLPELQLALGTYYTLVETSYERATVALDNAAMGLGESSDLYQQTGYLAKRQGDWERTLAHQQMALQLDPRSAIKCLDLADTYMILGAYEPADDMLDRAISVGSPSGEFFFYKIQNAINRYGNLDSARRIVAEASQHMDPARVMALGSRTSIEILGFWRFNLITEDLESLPRRFENLFDSPRRHVYYLSVAQIHEALGQSNLMDTYLDSALVHADSLVQKYYDDFHFVNELALINALVGRYDEAIQTGLRAKELMPVDLCHW